MRDQATDIGATDHAIPRPGAVVQVRSRRYLVEDVEAPTDTAWEQTLVDLSCLDDDAQGERLSVLWEREVDAKSLLSVLALGARGGTSLRLRAEGAESDAALRALAHTVAALS